LRTDLEPILARHPGLLHRARFAHFAFELRCSGERLHVAVDGTHIEARAITQDSSACDFMLEAESPAWAEFSQTMPRPGFHDIVALIESGQARFSGDGLAFFGNLFLVKGIISAVFRGEARW
jgi:hypothetical protein